MKMYLRTIFFAFGLMLFSLTGIAQSTAITLKAEKKTASTGSKVCVNISVDNFNKMLATQYSLRWDPKVLEYTGVQGFKLPFLSKDNFGLVGIKKGFLTLVWIENNLLGADLPSGSTMYQVCFTVKGKAGSSSNISFSSSPTPFEAVNNKEQLAKVSVVNGSVTVK
ncbi:cellulosome anchoring protein cohesin region [Haliscomenobacter hydrossis DSM 1100]|uniref:Cellulosome anchoring protein cohesin region n=2 Tax=Haliscomenobacter TaxID=2349 RepID=F4KR11_HALH1|nr:cellulosome anchoring protein cohesin region [Haliscomenobacter hydrossis DSM 1100]